MTQDEYTGVLHTSRRAAGVIVAAAVLSDRVEAGAVVVQRSRVVVLHSTPGTPAGSDVRVGADGGRRARVAVPDVVDGLGREVLAQVVREPGMLPGDVIAGLGVDVRSQVARRLVVAGRAQRRRSWCRRREWVAVARDHDVRPAWTSTGLVVKVARGEPLGAGERFLVQVVASSSLGELAFAGLNRDRLARALGPVDTAWQELLTATVGQLRDMALAR
ncbi:hypothetical protein GCM10012284_53300 [Mangrovihabitans endophyticus]|uniref:Uncharacterized protein n=1 Tax=Mangrovihabitans endophyticus TaxID=1751298 RepID=A0A8J3FRI2_9ACTN|nr:hypothetical protein GCM10012284_53300 [Mangrovihabitans endophyticus]